jgi:uncharacterized protein YhfF
MRFDHTYHLIVQDKKTETSRIPADKWYTWYKDHPQTGKLVRAEGPNGESCFIRITSVTIITCGEVRDDPEHYVREGFSTGKEFEEVWRKLYRRFDPLERVCSLRFVRV